MSFAVLGWSEPIRDRHVEAELIAEPVSIQPGKPFWVGLLLRHDEGWHSYWRNPGDSGLATKIKWSLPPGFAAGEIQWPLPSRILTPPLASYGYEREVLLLVEIRTPPNLESTSYIFRARAEWLMCKEICLPGRADLSLTVEVGEDPSPNPRHERLFRAAREALPREAPDWRVEARLLNDSIELVFEHPTRTVSGAQFFPFRDDLIVHAADQIFIRDGTKHILRIPIQTQSERPPAELEGILVAESAWTADPTHRAIPVKTDLKREARIGQIPPSADGLKFPSTLGASMMAAFVGGLILNLMPCVFPVISLKLLGFVSQSGWSRRRMVLHGLVFAAGVLVCFWILAGLLIALRAGGEEIGWGFQLQSPRIVLGLAALFFCLGLSLFGVFEFGLSLTTVGQELQSKSGYAGSFFSGLLATIVATPCTAPFMGAALGYALTQPPASALAIFTALGLGMAAPYVALSASPGIVRRIPKPGPWMESLKQAMGFLMMATVVWLVWVLSLQAGAAAVIRAASLFLILALSMWIAGRWGALHRQRWTRLGARAVAMLLAASALIHAFQSIGYEVAPEKPAHRASEWEPFSPERLAQLRREGRPVFIDFTAAWCLTCQVNKQVALRRPEVLARFREMDVALLVADWTDRNDVITRALEEFGRSGVPLYVYYPLGADSKPIILPEILTPRVVLDAIAGNR
ncbi:MAG: protein-disulfide reductase DsbD family protein [Kiritimatiellae bacterium]|nr:protein-disulfide reductase DsbD family protein [Kiritimatiellia bacterium]MDW8458482.1 protein-disulfide reductase DsbD family protein [Verrucomicrobiota bacterium]